MWRKENTNIIDLVMITSDRAEVCELAVMFPLKNLTNKFDQISIGLCGDNGLAMFRDLNCEQAV